ncbi:MAG: right-handed parallel beta-helix repeat-containing protein [Candidatus Hodarchaeales archaeon]|jgi:hypothetical protein
MKNYWKLINLVAFSIFMTIFFIPTDNAAAAVNCSDPGVICKNGTLGGNETWVSGNIYVITGGDLTVPIGVTLTLQEGVILKLDISKSLLVDGIVNINGVSGNEVIITSVRDDYGGDTDHTAIAPAPGNWKYVNFRNGSTGNLNYTEFRYGGGSFSYNGLLRTEAGASVTVDHGKFKNSQGCAIRSDPAYEVTMTNMASTDFTGSQYNGMCFVGGSVGVNATWDETEAAYILVNDLTVISGITLDLGPGIVIKPYSSGTDLFVDGTLNANGTTDNRVYITSIKDDSVGGQTNNNANPPAPGNWASVHFRNGSSGTLNYMEFRYGGGFISYNGLLRTDAGTTVSVDHGKFKKSQGCAIRSDPAYEVTMTNMASTDLTGSQYNGMCFVGASVDVNATWDETEAAYILVNDLTVTSGITLDLGPGIVIKPYSSGTDLFVDGILNANGTEINRINVTSINDDSVGGQTNNNANKPGLRNWGQIYFRENSNGNLSYVQVRYGGGSYGSSAIRINNSSPSLTNTTVTKNPTGIFVQGQFSNPTISNCDIFDNSDYGMYNMESGHWITARNNYWGSLDGPYDPSPPGIDGSYNYGSGDRVNDYIDYQPWISILKNSVFIPVVFNNP